MLELAPRFQADPGALSLLYFKGNGPVVPLDTLATAKPQIGPQTVNHYGQLTSVTLSFGLAEQVVSEQIDQRPAFHQECQT